VLINRSQSTLRQQRWRLRYCLPGRAQVDYRTLGETLAYYAAVRDTMGVMRFRDNSKDMHLSSCHPGLTAQTATDATWRFQHIEL
jgi:hypothetical protein